MSQRVEYVNIVMSQRVEYVNIVMTQRLEYANIVMSHIVSILHHSQLLTGLQ